jgi:hypothetical protein
MGRDYYGDDDTDQHELSEDQIEMQELLEDQERINDLEVPEVRWKEDIERIPDLDLKLEEIQKAEKFIAEKKALDDRLENGEISLGAYDSILRPRMRKATTRCGLASVGLTYDHLGDVSEDAELYATGDLKMLELKDRLKDTIEDIGPKAAEELADRMHEDERLSDDTDERIKIQIRLKRSNGVD